MSWSLKCIRRHIACLYTRCSCYAISLLIELINITSISRFALSISNEVLLPNHQPHRPLLNKLMSTLAMQASPLSLPIIVIKNAFSKINSLWVYVWTMTNQIHTAVSCHWLKKLQVTKMSYKIVYKADCFF